MPCSLQLLRITPSTPAAAASRLLEPLAAYHSHHIRPNQCTSTVVQTIEGPLQAVWSLLRRFDNPQAYKHFLKNCRIIHGHGGIGLREARVVSGLPAACSHERLEILDDEAAAVVVVESYVVDVPEGNTEEEMCVFVDTIVRCKLQSLARIAQDITVHNNT